MDAQYGIAIHNKYDLFIDDDEDPFEVLKQQEEAAQKSKDKLGKDAKTDKSKSVKTKSTKKPNQPQQVQVQDKSNKTDLNQNKKDEKFRGKPRQERDDRGGKPLKEGGNQANLQRKEKNERYFEKSERPQATDFRDRVDRTDRPEGMRGRGRGRGFGRGRGRGGFDRQGKRDFDRHSGSEKTGVKPVDKREGGGAHNWGTLRDDLEEQNFNDSNVSEENTEWADRPEEAENLDPNEQVDQEETEPAEPTVKEMTLDEYKAMQSKSTPAQFNIRKAGEGVDDGQWKKTYVLSKKKDVNSDEEEEEESDEEDDDRHRKQNMVNIEITFNDVRKTGRGRGGRGTRGGGRGRFDERGEQRGERGSFEDRGRGGRGRGERGRGRGFGDRGRGFGGGNTGRGRGPREVAPNVEDEQDFPSLIKPVAS